MNFLTGRQSNHYMCNVHSFPGRKFDKNGTFKSKAIFYLFIYFLHFRRTLHTTITTKNYVKIRFIPNHLIIFK